MNNGKLLIAMYIFLKFFFQCEKLKSNIISFYSMLTIGWPKHSSFTCWLSFRDIKWCIFKLNKYSQNRCIIECQDNSFIRKEYSKTKNVLQAHFKNILFLLTLIFFVAYLWLFVSHAALFNYQAASYFVIIWLLFSHAVLSN